MDLKEINLNYMGVALSFRMLSFLSYLNLILFYEYYIDYLPVELVTLVEVVFTVWLLLTSPSAGDALTLVARPLFVVVTFVLLKLELEVVVVSYYKEMKK
jgi:hypothetical protein